MASELSAVADAIRANDRFLLVTHENPDGDALGSILAMKLALDALGKDSVMYVGGDLVLPPEYAFMPLDGLSRTLPDDVAERVILALDSATAPRTQLPPELLEAAPLTIDVDHHHDNTRYGRINLIVPRGVVDRRDRPRSARRARRRADSRDRRGDLRRARHRHGEVPVHEHHSEGAPARSRADRERRSAAGGLPADLRVGAVRPAEAQAASHSTAPSCTRTAG